MAIRWKHDDSTTMYFCTFTCYNWLPLIEKVNGYDMIYKWFAHLKEQDHDTVAAHEQGTLNHLASVVTEREKKKGQLHKVFIDSFDAKGIYNEKFFNQKLKYIHRNPVSGKWKLVIDYTDYEHSSASFYETGKVKGYEPN
jgi:hypothetical protein